MMNWNVLLTMPSVYLNNYSTMVALENTYDYCRQVLKERLRETAPDRIQILTGPRQVGKTTLLLELAEQFGDQTVYTAGDDPCAAVPGFWERCWIDAEARVQRGPVVLILDEIHRLPDWAAKLKGSGTAFAANAFPSTSLLQARRRCMLPVDREKVWPGDSSD